MWGYIVSAMTQNSNYALMNVENLYKFWILTMETLNEEQKKKFIENLKFIMGKTISDNFKKKIFDKTPKSELLKYFDN
ncbi:hypothetical protein Catovirus_1_772 [Catovirus CTV1]|uniref:Uncharacterized protein n=1 Tax=Catovirus CTV1 TaxID=1977631 RepID=A0A1V0SAI3_9VIRU|nr:hypothetical protein Catovirus_1_772 [Catovirus CTV1]